MHKFLGHHKKHVAVILNSGDAFGDKERHKYYHHYTHDFREMGFTTEELDLRHYFGRAEALKDKLCDFGMIWAVGGNTFTLRKAFHYSGLDRILPELLRNDKIAYGGFSAGACILCPTLHGTEMADSPYEIIPHYGPEIMWDGLNLIDFHLAPHYKGHGPEAARIDDIIDYWIRRNFKFEVLSDGEVIISEFGQYYYFRNF